MKTTMKSLIVTAMLLLPAGAFAGDYPDNVDNASKNWLQRSTNAGDRPGSVTDDDAPATPNAPSPVGSAPWLLLGLAACAYGATKQHKKLGIRN
jgi:hypothetical protein